jgi:uncharacterized membrane protein
MRIALLTGLGAGILCGLLHFCAITGLTSAGGVFYYAPLFIYFGAIYFSIKRNATVNHNNHIEFKQALKYGGFTALLVSLGILIGVFVAFTHTDVQAQLKAMIAANMTKEEIKLILANMTKQKMFDQAKFFTMTYFLLGFVMTLGAAFVVKLFQAKSGSKV